MHDISIKCYVASKGDLNSLIMNCASRLVCQSSYEVHCWTSYSESRFMLWGRFHLLGNEFSFSAEYLRATRFSASK